MPKNESKKENHARKENLADRLKDIYDKKHIKLMLIPNAILAIAIIVIIINVILTGEIIDKDISLRGGVSLTLFRSGASQDAITRFLESQHPKQDINVRSLSEGGIQKGLVIESSDIDAEDLVASLKQALSGLSEDEYTVEYIGSSLGSSFFRQTAYAIIIAFVFMAAVVFIYFKIPIPSLAVILAAVSDMICTWAFLIVFGFKLSTAGVAAFLMLIGYSVDTDILLTTRVLKRRGGVFEAILGAMKTGVTMTMAALAAVIVAYIFSQSTVLKEIMLILMVGLCFDLIFTWLQNASLLRWYVEKTKYRMI